MKYEFEIRGNKLTTTFEDLFEKFENSGDQYVAVKILGDQSHLGEIRFSRIFQIGRYINVSLYDANMKMLFSIFPLGDFKSLNISIIDSYLSGCFYNGEWVSTGITNRDITNDEMAWKLVASCRYRLENKIILLDNADAAMQLRMMV